ncbi:MAG: efflux RND transporter periplasmic adaptor subunit [Blastocatellia bacterium]
MNRNLKDYSLLFPLILSLTLGFSGCGGRETAASQPGGPGGGGPGGGGPGGGRGGPGGPGGGGPGSLPVKPVRLVTAEERTLPRLVTAPGTLAADESITFSFKVAGRLSRINVDLGSIVRKGQVIAQLETTDFDNRVEQSEAALQQARVRLGLPPEATDDPNDDRITIENTALVRQAKAVLEEARINHERAQRLVREGVQPQAELDRTNSSLKVAEGRYQDAIEEVRNRQAVLAQRRSELALARQQLAYTTLRAPAEGSVLERHVSQGEAVPNGSPVVTVVRVHPLRMRVEVPEREAIGIRQGLPVRVPVEGIEGEFSGRVVRISPAIQEQSRTLIIEAEVDNRSGRLRPGTFAKALIQTSTANGVIMVPASAIVSFAGIQKVFLVRENKAVERQVVIGTRQNDWVEITDGLAAGESVVDKPENLVSGQPVSLEKK